MTLHILAPLDYNCHKAEFKADKHTIYNFHAPLFCLVRITAKNRVLKALYYRDTI